MILIQGHFILDASFNDINNFDLYPNIGTEVGVCKTINPMVRAQYIRPNISDTSLGRLQ